jgi:hypothetical protein
MKSTKSKVAETVIENLEERQGFGKTVWKDILAIQTATGAVVYGNPTAWWNGEISLAFLRFHFGNRTDTSEKILLLWDDFSGHWTPAVTAYAEEIGVLLKKVPAGYTWIAQPADVVWNHTLKNHIRKKWIDNLRLQVAKHERPAKFILKPPTRAILAAWIQGAWDSLKASTIRNGFSRCGLVLPAATAAPVDEEDFAALDESLLEDLVRLNVAEEVDFENDFLNDNAGEVPEVVGATDY